MKLEQAISKVIKLLSMLEDEVAQKRDEQSQAFEMKSLSPGRLDNIAFEINHFAIHYKEMRKTYEN